MGLSLLFFGLSIGFFLSARRSSFSRSLAMADIASL
jgi:hypothetical protein